MSADLRRAALGGLKHSHESSAATIDEHASSARSGRSDSGGLAWLDGADITETHTYECTHVHSTHTHRTRAKACTCSLARMPQAAARLDGNGCGSVGWKWLWLDFVFRRTELERSTAARANLEAGRSSLRRCSSFSVTVDRDGTSAAVIHSGGHLATHSPDCSVCCTAPSACSVRRSESWRDVTIMLRPC